MKKLLAILMAFTVLCGLTVSVSVAASDEPIFSDVPADSWYHIYVYTAVRQELLRGKTATEFAPEDNLTQAEAVVLASRYHQLLDAGEVTLGEAEPVPGEPWYEPYLVYADSTFLRGWNVGVWGEAVASEPITKKNLLQCFS